MTVTSVGSQTLRTLLGRGKGTSPSCRIASTLSHCNLDRGLRSHHRKDELVSVSSGSSRVWPSGGLGLGSHSVGDWSWPPLISRNQLQQSSPTAPPMEHCICQDHTTHTFRSCANVPSKTDSVFTGWELHPKASN